MVNVKVSSFKHLTICFSEVGHSRETGKMRVGKSLKTFGVTKGMCNAESVTWL